MFHSNGAINSLGKQTVEKLIHQEIEEMAWDFEPIYISFPQKTLFRGFMNTAGSI
jgi:hypothetical protein